MSTEEILRTLCQNGTLVRFEPVRAGNEGIYRRIYLRPSIHEWLYPPAGARKALVSYGAYARRYLKSFVIGEHFDDVEKLKNLDTDDFNKTDEGVWSIRLKQNPQVRILGSFTEANIFVGLSRHDRGDLPEGEWINEKTQVKTDWAGLFKIVSGTPTPRVHTLKRLVGPSRLDLTSNNRP